MHIRSAHAASRFKWAIFRGRCRRNLFAGLLLLVLAGGYGAWAGKRLGTRGADASGAFDQPLVGVAARLARPPVHLGNVTPQNDRELYLAAVISDQHDTLFGVTLLVLRLMVILTIAGLGLVLLTAGATEWEIRSGPLLGGSQAP